MSLYNSKDLTHIDIGQSNLDIHPLYDKAPVLLYDNQTYYPFALSLPPWLEERASPTTTENSAQEKGFCKK